MNGPDASNPPGAARHADVGAAFAALSADLLALLDVQGRIVWVNAGFVSASGWLAAQAAGWPVVELLGDAEQGAMAWSAVADAVAAGASVNALELPWRYAGGESRWGRLALRPVRATPEHPLARVAFCLQDRTEQHRLAAEAHRLAELLDMAQEFGRVGVWERSIRTGEGRWDPHVFRFFGLDPSSGTPNFVDALQRIHPDDRANERFSASTFAAGRYENRYRIVLDSGRIRRIHSQWEIQNSAAGVPDRAVGVMVDDTEVYELARSFSEATEQLRLAVELGNIAIWRQDAATRRFFPDDRAFRVLGLTPRPEGMALQEMEALIHPDDLPGVRASVNHAVATRLPVDIEARYRRTDGSWRYLLTRSVLRLDVNDEPLEFVGVALDVTEQVEKSRHAGELAQRLEIATESAGLGVFSRDPDTESGEWNAEMFRIMGLPPERGVPSRDEWIERIVHPDDRAILREAMDSLLVAPRDTQEHEYRIVRPDGEVRWLLNRVRRVVHHERRMIYGITIDVTDRVRTEAALRSANERVALAARSVGMGIWEWEPASGAASWDAAMFRLRGREPQDAAPEAAARLAMIHPDDRGVDALLREAAAQGRSAAYEFRVVWPDGSVHWLASRSTPLYDAQGQLTRYVGVNWDITERVSAETAQREKLVAQRESEAKSQFLARMSHELRTPLNAVLGFAQLLQLDSAGASAEQRSRVDHIRAAGEHLLSLINDVLDLSSLETGQVKLDLQPVALAELVAEAIPLVTPLARSVGVTLSAGRVEGVVLADRTRLRQVLLNLLSNAIKYNRAHGKVYIEGSAAEGRVTLRVRDTGRGLTAEQRSHLFEPFNRLGAEREGIEGTGIGLAIVKALVERMAGVVVVGSEPGVGTVVEVVLPRGEGQPAAPDELPAPANLPPALKRMQRSGQLLYIEDNPVNVMLVEELVAAHSGLTIVSEPTGESGVARARVLRPDLILVDMQLPDFDGFEVLRRLRQQPETAAIPCIVLSANAMPEDVSRALAAGFADYWTKPIDFGAFLSSLDALLQARR